MQINYKELPKKARVKQGIIESILHNAVEFGYELLQVDYGIGMIRLGREFVRVNIYTTTLSVTIETKHPIKGRQQTQCKKLMPSKVIDVLEYPRKYVER